MEQASGLFDWASRPISPGKFWRDAKIDRRDAGSTRERNVQHFPHMIPRKNPLTWLANPMFFGYVKNSYLTVVAVTRVLFNVYRGFVFLKKCFREAFQIGPFVLL